MKTNINLKSTEQTEIILKGIPCSPGLAYGKATVIQPDTLLLPSVKIPVEEIDNDLERFDVAINELTEDFLIVLDKVQSEAKNVTAIIETNLLFLKDPFLIDSIRNRIKSGFSAESSVIQEFDSQKQFLIKSKDAIIREKAIELDNIMERLLATLRKQCIHYAVSAGSIVIAQSVTPTDLINFKESKVAGIITEIGGIASHSSILARSFEIPSVIGLKDATQLIHNSNIVIVDGYAGIIIINPSNKSTENYQERKNKENEYKQNLGSLIKLPCKTKDGKVVKLLANVDFPDDVESAILIGAEGIGLLRSENLVMKNGKFLTEDEQTKWFTEIADRMYPQIITIRAYDIGSDKFTEGLPRHEANPALGFRGIRFLLHRLDIFETQIRAILRASKNKNVRFMLPMITNIEEVEKTIKLIEKCKLELDNENLFYDSKMPVGIMIETPSAAILADKFAKYADFFSIGTNDLTQYLLAADRTNELVSDFFDAFHPSVISMINYTVKVAKSKKIPVGICGELAGHSAATELLLGLGIDELSIPPSILLDLKSRILNIDYKKACKLTKKVLTCSTSNEVRNVLIEQ